MSRRREAALTALRSGARAAACAALVGLSVPSTAQAAPEIERLIKALAHRAETLTCVRGDIAFRVHRTDAYYRLTGAPPSSPDDRAGRGTWAADRRSVYVEYVEDKARPGNPSGRKIVAWADGQRRVRIEENPASNTQDVFLSSKPAVPDNPLEYGYTHRGAWYADILRAPGFRVVGSGRDPLFGRTVTVCGPIGHGQQIEITFATEAGPIAIRAERRDKNERDRSSRTVWSVLQTSTRAGTVLPTRYRWEWYLIEKTRPVLLQVRDGELVSSRLTAERSELLSVPQFRSGALVRDEDKQCYYRVAQDGSLEFAGNMGDRGPLDPIGLGPAAWLSIVGVGGALAVGGTGLARRSVRRR